MAKKNNLITYRHLERLFTCQEYFVWNSNASIKLNELEDEEENSLWEVFADLDLEELKDYKYVEIIKNGYDFVNQLFLKQIF